MSSSFVERAASALAAGDPGRAVALAGRGLSEAGPRLPLLRLLGSALAGVLARTGLLDEDGGRGPTPPHVLRDGAHAAAVRDVVSQYQRALYGLAGEREPGALRAIFELAGALSHPEPVRVPEAGAPRAIVVSMLCCERYDLLRRTVANLLDSDLPPSELVFFEDASRDPRVLAFLRELDAGEHRVHVLANRGFSTRSWPANQNRVLEYADARLGDFDVFATCDSDMALHPRWWSAAGEVLRAASGMRLPEGRLGVVTTFQPDDAHAPLREAEVEGVRFRIRESFGGCQVIVPREVCRDVLGPLDHTSDWGWCARLRAAGRFVAATIPSRSQHLGDESLLFHPSADRAGDFVGA